MIKIAICDDEEKYRINVRNAVKHYFTTVKYDCDIGCFSSGIELLDSKEKFDLILLDIDMKPIDGVGTAEQLRKKDRECVIVYITNYSDYQRLAFKVHAFDYITKPINYTILSNLLTEVLMYSNDKSLEEKFCFNTEEGKLFLKPSDIYYFEFFSKKLKIVSNINVTYGRYSLNEVYNNFKHYNFEMPHKSFIVNMSHIKLIKKFDIYLQNNDIIPLAQKRSVQFKNIFNNYLQESYYTL